VHGDAYNVLSKVLIILLFYQNIVHESILIKVIYVVLKSIQTLISSGILVFKEKKLVEQLKEVIEEVVILAHLANRNEKKIDEKKIVENKKTMTKPITY
jgi:hypothetical protein